MSKSSFLKTFLQEIWNEQQYDKIAAYVHPQYTVFTDFSDPWEGKTIDHDAYRERMQLTFLPFPDTHFEVTSAIEGQNEVAITWILTATNLGNIGEMPPTGKPIKTTGMTIYHFTDGLLSGHTQVVDRMTVARQLGLVDL